jgi:DnaK suppressor protein
MAAARRPGSTPDLETAVNVIPVADGEDPWTPEELAEVRADLVGEVARMERAILVAEAELEDLLRDGGDGAGRDPADVGSSNFERDQEMSLAQNAREMLEQSQLALRLFDDGHFGTCETCGTPIGKGRLQVFPRATMCVKCKQREERR